MSQPVWLDLALSTPFVQDRVASEGAEIEVRRRPAKGEPKQSVLLLHGLLAHARWWDATAALLPQDWDVVAMSFSGMGQSDWRQHYSLEQDIRDVETILNWAQFKTKPMLVGHSFGGGIGTYVYKAHQDRFDRFVIVDSGMRFAPVEQPSYLNVARKYYPDKETALSRFRFIPEQPVVQPDYVRYLAEHSVRTFDDQPQGEGRWSWIFDFARVEALKAYPNFWLQVFENYRSMDPLPGFIRGQLSAICPQPWVDQLQQIMGGEVPLITIEGSYHHVLLDRPDALAKTLEAM